MASYTERILFQHKWKKLKMIGKFTQFVCEDCGIICIGKQKDNYQPPAYDYYVKSNHNLTCDEMIAIDIIT